MKGYTTQNIMKLLDVSRTWINANLRHLGSEKPIHENSTKMSIMYDEKEIVAWFNDNATFTRQTILEDLSKFITLELLEKQEQEEQEARDLFKMETKNLSYRETRTRKNKLEIALNEERLSFFKKQLEPAIFNRHLIAINNTRNRGNVPHVNINYQIKSLNQLHTMNAIKGGKSEEMGYREIYNNAMIKVQLNGRKWYIYDNINCEHQILLTAV